MQFKVQMALWLWLFWGNLYAQTVTIVNAITQEPIEYVYVKIQKNQWQGISNSEGKIQLPTNSWEDLDTLIFEMLNYEPVQIAFSKLRDLNYVLTLDPLINELNEVVVTASRWSNIKSQTPFSFTQIDQNLIEKVQPQTAADLLDVSGQVFIQKSQMGGGSPMIRGFSANRLLLLVDGVRMNSAIFRSGNLHNVISIDPRSVGNTEIFLGPSSVLFGSDAIGGAINFSTLTPEWSEGDSIIGEYEIGSKIGTVNQERTIHGHLKWANKKWGWVSHLSYSEFGDLRMGRNGGFNSYKRFEFVKVSDNGLNDEIISNDNPLQQIATGYNQWNILQKIQFKPNQNLVFSLAFHHSGTSDIPRYDRLLVRDNDGTGFKSAQWYYGPQIWQMIHLKMDAQVNGKLADVIQADLAFQKHKESRFDRNFDFPILNQRIEHVNMVNFSLDLEKKLKRQKVLQYGAEWVFNRIFSKGMGKDIASNLEIPINSRYPNLSSWQNLAVFTQLKKVLNQFALTAGIRGNLTAIAAAFDTKVYPLPYEEFNLLNGNLSGGIGITYTPSIFNWLGLNISSGYRAPNLDDIAKVFDSEPGNVLVPNVDLKPENAVTIDWNYHYENQSLKTSFSFNLFYTHLNNALVRRDYTFNGMDSIFYDGVKSKVQSIVNTASAQVYGGGMEWELAISPFTLWMGNINIQKGFEIDGGDKYPLRHAAPTFGSTSIQINQDALFSRLTFRFNGKIRGADMPISEKSKPYLYPINSEGQLYTPSWMVFDWYVGYQLSRPIEFKFGIENILDRQYRTYSSGIVAPGRNFFFSILYSGNSK